jgi:hypothetical protein
VFTNLCDNPPITVVNDPFPTDNEAGAAIAYAVAAACPEAGVTVSIVPQTKPGVLVHLGDAGFQPNTGVGTTLVAGGGAYGQVSVAYMDQTAATPVYLTNDGTTSHIIERSTGVPIVTALDSTVNNVGHDFFFLELAVEPNSGTLCLFGMGIYGQGTIAAGFWGSQMFNLADAGAAFYVVEWTDTGDMIPNAADTFTLLYSGQ